MKYIGIDCGEHTGVAVWDTETMALSDCYTCHLHKALADVLNLSHQGDVCVIFEDARQRRWIPRERTVSEYRGRLMGAGSVKRDAVIWQEFCTDNAIPFQAIAPRKGLTKWEAPQFKAVTKWQGRTSNHARDAALLVFGRTENKKNPL